jgi:hypothetical protein
VNPNHLRLGTQKDNIHDMIEKKRHNKPKGTAHWSVKLTEKQVLEIREKRASGIAELDLAKEYNVHRSTIYGAVNGLYWKHL